MAFFKFGSFYILYYYDDCRNVMKRRPTAHLLKALVFSKLNICNSRRMFYLGREYSARWNRVCANPRNVSRKLKKNRMKKIVLIMVSVFFLCCERAKPFFEFDKVEHYQVNQEDEVSKSLKVSRDKWTKQEWEFQKILMEYNYPKSVKDSSFLKSVQTLYPKNKNIDRKLFRELSNIFSIQKNEPIDEKACDPFFRDILIFKKDDKIIGIAKICFECEQSYIVGASGNSKNFGANEEFKKLKNIISQ